MTLSADLARSASRPMDPLPAMAGIGALVRQLAAMFNQEVDRRLAPHHLTLTKSIPLILLLQGRCETVTSIARCGHCDAGAMTRVISELETTGLVARERSVADRRVVRLGLTALGKDKAATAAGIFASVSDDHLRGFSPEERDTFLGYLHRVNANGE